MLTYVRKSLAKRLGMRPINIDPITRSFSIRRSKKTLSTKQCVAVDLGSGFNPWILSAADKCSKIFLVDMWRKPKNTLPSNVTLLRENLESKMSIEDNSVDLVICLSVIEHLTTDGKLNCMHEIGRILKPGGHAMLSIAVFFPSHKKIFKSMQESDYLNKRNCSVYSPANIKKLVEASGLDIIKGGEDTSMFTGYTGFDASVYEDSDIMRQHLTMLPSGLGKVYFTEVCMDLVKNVRET